MKLYSILSVLLAGSAGAASLPAVPKTVVIDGLQLAKTKRALLRGDSSLQAALSHLQAQADNWLNQGPWTVTAKDKPPPGGTIHDYASQAPYYWPNPNTSDGCPYINKDGQRNPEVDKYQDRKAVGKMFNSTYVLSLAWYYTGRAEYAAHAVKILRTWFLDPDTAMAPNLNHAQIIPCANTGRSIGIIDFSQEYTNVLDAVAILSTGAPGWKCSDAKAFKKWNKQFLSWLTDSKFGKAEANAANNHGTFANMQIAALALFTGNKTLARDTSKLMVQFIDKQIREDGYMPDEVARTRSWHYTNFNLGAMLRWALVAKKVGINVYSHEGPKGQSLFKAVNVTIAAAVDGPSRWPYEDLEFQRFAGTDNIHAAALAGLEEAKSAVNDLQPPPGGDIFALRPAAQQLDSIVTL
ncbi:hypothetical protein NLG97_g7904 [Lecanicillium saksenae]|uniref:Uncharacterized protein n=1 Tax=Lecanicillium saksenae TaxID=468837 RepID=A0ACC1QKG1_9HYPO|nr:hypothetical protein NLG97_g7904 [Lecanicillium saksenae]